MKRVLLFGLLVSLQADVDMNNYALKKQDHTQKKYFIKFAACKNIETAIKIQQSASFPTTIIYMEKYYSLISKEFKNSNSAKSKLKQFRKKYKDAYLIRLYKKQIIKATVQPEPKLEIKQIVQKPTKLQNAIKLYNVKRYEEALMAFDMILIDTPNDINAKIYYAKTLYELKLFKEAKKEFELLDNAPLDRQTKKEIRNYLEAIEKRQKRHFFNAIIGVGVGHNDNINLTTDAKTTKYGNYTLLNDTNKTDSTYGLATLSLTHKYLGESFSLYSKLYSYNEFAHTVDGNNLNLLDVSTAIIKKYGKFSITIPVGFNTSYLDGNDIGYNIYTNPNVSYAINKKFKIFVNASFLDNTTKFSENRDYRLVSGGAGIRYRKDSLYTILGINIQNITAKENLRFDVSKDSISYFAQSRYQVSKTLYLGASLSFNSDQYTELDSVMGYKREDDILHYGLFMGKNITKNSLLNFKYQHITNDSNINVYTYDKNTYTLEFKYKL